MCYLEDNHLAPEDGHEVPWFLPHGDSDLNRLTSILLVQSHSLIRTGRHLVLRCMTSLPAKQITLIITCDSSFIAPVH